MERLAREVPDRPARSRPTRCRCWPHPPRRQARARAWSGGTSATAPARAARRRWSLAAKIRAILDGRFNVAFEDIRAVALPALRHRLILNFEGEAEGITSEAVVRSILDEVTPPAVE